MNKEKENIMLPFFMIECGEDFFLHRKRAGIKIMYDRILPAPLILEKGENLFCVLGNPILGEKFSKVEACRILAETEQNQRGKDILADLNGEFLIFWFQLAKGKVRIINDRFSSIPLYYFKKENYFFGSVYYKDIWKKLRPLSNGHLRKESFFEFIWLQKLLGDKTYDKYSKFFSSGSSLCFDGKEIKLKHYWFPEFKKDEQSSLNDLSKKLAELLKKSINRKTSDNKRFGLFLSGGRDSRAVLAAFEKPLVCFTASADETNNEYLVAKCAAQIKGVEHIFIPCPAEQYSFIMEAGSILGGGMYLFPHALFLGMDEYAKPNVDVVFHGHGIDYFFQGMYMPVNHRYLFGRKTYLVRLRKLESDLVGDFLANINYRLKGISLLDYVKTEYKERMLNSIRNSVREILREGENYCNTPYDFWEYLLVHNLSRHYTNPNLSSMATYVEQRTIAFDNDLFSFYLSLPEKVRLGAGILRKTLRLLNPELAKLRSGNTNIRADYSPFMQTTVMMGDWLLRKCNIVKRSHLHPLPEERAWPVLDVALRSQKKLYQAAEALCYSDYLGELDFLDMDKVKKSINEWLKNPSGGGNFIFTLMTIDTFLRLK